MTVERAFVVLKGRFRILMKRMDFDLDNVKTVTTCVQVITAGDVYNISRGGSKTAATAKMELFVIIVNGFSSCDNSQLEPIKHLRWSFFFLFFYLNFYFYFHQIITTQMLKSKTHKNFLYNKHKIKHLKVKIKANNSSSS